MIFKRQSCSPSPENSPRRPNYPILTEINELAEIHPNTRKYSSNIIFFSCGLLAIGLSAYLYVQNYLPLPHIRAVYPHQSEYLTITPELLSNISNVRVILQQYKTLLSNNEKNNTKFIIASTSYSFSYVLSTIKGEVDLNRFSTSPLEHNFGIARMCCRDNNRMDRLLLQFSRIDVRRLKKMEMFDIFL